MLKYSPKGALCPVLASAMQKLFKITSEKGLMASLIITDGKHAEFSLSLDPDWSCCKMNKLPGGDISVRIRSKREDYKTTAEQKAHIERTINGLALMYQVVNDAQAGLTGVMTDLQRAVKFEHYGEEFKGHTSEPPDPDKVPSTLKEAADLIHATLDADQIEWIKRTPVYEALPQLHHGFGQNLRNSWSLHEDTPLRRYVRETYGLFGHADDLTSLIFTWLWAEVKGGGPDAEVVLEAEGLKAHWRKGGINPETGEKGLIL